jgi:hypothetical protein
MLLLADLMHTKDIDRESVRTNDWGEYLDVIGRKYSSSVIKMIKSRKMRRMKHIACMREKRNAYKILVGKPDEK